jgi:hypothetical protein
VAAEDYTLEEAEDHIADLRGQLDKMGEIITVGSIVVQGNAGPLGNGLASGPDTWQTLGSPSATGYTSDHGRYRFALDGEVEFDIALHGTSGAGTAGTYTYANTLPAAYRPALDRVYPLANSGSGAGAQDSHLNVNASGSVQLVLGAHTTIGGCARMPLD